MIWNNVGRPFPESPDGVLGAASTIASIFAGFSGVSQSIILTIKDTKLFKAIKANGYEQEVFSYMRSSIIASAIFTLSSLFGFFVQPESAIFKHHIIRDYHEVWLFLASYAFLTFYRMTTILFKMLKQSIT